jgi:hypothetical protein
MNVVDDILPAIVGCATATASAVTGALAVLVFCSVAGDVVHAVLHALSRVRWPPLRALAALHGAHHAFYDAKLNIYPRRFWRSAALHLLPEAGVRTALCILAGRAAGVGGEVVAAAVVVVVVDLVFVLARRGRDAWHGGALPLPAPRGVLVVDGAYHALHHAFPDHFLSAHLQVLDRVFGTMLPLRRRRVVLTGSSPFVAALQQALGRAGADVVRVDVDAVADAGTAGRVFASADVVVLGHGAQVRGKTAYEAVLALAVRAHGDRPLPLDVWAIGDDPAWRARARLLDHRRVILRRLVRAERLGARLTMALLRRGARTI